jgi:cytidyltransferase-like protein
MKSFKESVLLDEAKTKGKVIVVYGGGFQPFHAGHLSSYTQAKQKFKTPDFYVASSNDTKVRPIPFKDKEFLAQQAGVTDDFVQVVQPINPEEIMKKYDEKKDVLILVRSERDPMKYTKKDGSPAYYQPFVSIDKCESFETHAYIFVTKKYDFKVNGKEAFSGSQVRKMYSDADSEGRDNIIGDLYPKAKNKAKVTFGDIKSVVSIENLELA